MKVQLAFFLSNFLATTLQADSIELTEFPQQLAAALGVDLFTGKLIAVGILLMLFMLPAFLLTRNANAHLMIGMIPFGISIALGWLPIWFFAILILLIAFRFGRWASRYGD